MYSDMSMRMSAFSSSNRYSASALVSSVLPTPVGPRNMNEPIGRLGSCKPARARRTAVDTACTASFCPMTRLDSASSMRRSFSFSPSIVHLFVVHAGPARHCLGDILGGHGLFGHGVSLGFGRFDVFELFLDIG